MVSMARQIRRHEISMRTYKKWAERPCQHLGLQPPYGYGRAVASANAELQKELQLTRLGATAC